MQTLHCFGSFWLESIAYSRLPGNETIAQNVKFEAYLNDNQNQIESDIASMDNRLYIAISVENEGRLENIKIDFEDSNFVLKDNPEMRNGNIESIGAGYEKIVELPIVARKDSRYNLSLLNMTSQIKLTGEYIDSQGNVTDLEEVKEVTITWTTNDVTSEDIEISQKLIANGIYSIDGEEKRIVQVLVNTNLKDNKVPVRGEILEINVPNIEEMPESVRVSAKSTNATNGKGDIEFNDQISSRYEYNEEEGKVRIEVQNNETEDNFISWEQNAKNEFYITFVYGKDVVVDSFVSNVKTQMSIYGTDQTVYLNNLSSIPMQEKEEEKDLVLFERWLPSEIYKGYMYAKQDTNYTTLTDIFISYHDAIDKITVRDAGEIKYGENKNLSGVFSKTKINRQQALNLLGNEGKISIFDGDNPENLIGYINLEDETDESNYEIIYDSSVTKILIEISKPVKE